MCYNIIRFGNNFLHKGAGMRVPTTQRYSIFILLILLLAGCRSHPRLTATPIPAPTSTAEMVSLQPAPTATPVLVILRNGWYLYRDPDGVFSFAYPPTAILTAGQNPVDGAKNILIQFLLPDKPYQGMSIRLAPNPKRLPAADLARQLYEVNAQHPAAAAFTDSLQTIKVGGLPGVKAYIPATNTELTVIVPYDVQVFILSPVHDSAMTKVDPETLDLFNQILASMEIGTTK
jgi:hypothetical protein